MMDNSGPWQALTAELDVWAAADRTATFWWRDDDAVTTGPALDRLLAIAETSETPLCLAVVPAKCEPSLVTAVAQSSAKISVAVHGWCHVNQAAEGEKKSEFPDSRVAETSTAEAVQGLASMRAAFGARALEVFVPPWNRISQPLVTALPAAGYQGLSTYKARQSATPVPGLRQVNSHADIVDWQKNREFAGAEAVLELIIAHLIARRDNAVDHEEPTGLLTHHLIHQDDAFGFIAQFLRLTGDHSAAEWPDPRLFFGLS